VLQVLGWRLRDAVFVDHSLLNHDLQEVVAGLEHSSDTLHIALRRSWLAQMLETAISRISILLFASRAHC
jgi:hypothetical protein